MYTLLLKVYCKLIFCETSKDLEALFKCLTLELWIHLSEPSQQHLQAKRRKKCNFVLVAWWYLVISWGSNWVKLSAIHHVQPRTNSRNSEAESEGEEELRTIHNVVACFMLKKGELLRISHISDGKQCEWGIFLISLWLGVRKASFIFEWVH